MLALPVRSAYNDSTSFVLALVGYAYLASGGIGESPSGSLAGRGGFLGGDLFVGVQGVVEGLDGSVDGGGDVEARGPLGDALADSGGLDDGGIGDVVPQASGHAGVGSGAFSVGGTTNGCVGKNNARNRAWRAKRAARRAARAGARVVDASDGGGSVPSGFWNSCSADVRNELIDTKAKWHIAENKLRACEAEKRVAEISGPVASVEHVLSVLRKCSGKKQLDSVGLRDWAEAVAIENAVGIAKDAPVEGNISLDVVETFEAKNTLLQMQVEDLQKEVGNLQNELVLAKRLGTKPVVSVGEVAEGALAKRSERTDIKRARAVLRRSVAEEKRRLMNQGDDDPDMEYYARFLLESDDRFELLRGSTVYRDGSVEKF